MFRWMTLLLSNSNFGSPLSFYWRIFGLVTAVRVCSTWPQPRLVIPWIRLVIRAIENVLARVIGPNHDFRNIRSKIAATIRRD